MASHSAGTIQALYRVFVLPTSIPTSCLGRRTSRAVHRPIRLLPAQYNVCNSFSTTRVHQSKARGPEIRAEKWDEEITARLIYLVDPETNRLHDSETSRLPEPKTRYDVLSRLNRETHRLVQMPGQEGENSPNFIPVCKIVSKKAAFDADRRRKAEAKERKKLESASKSVKTLELNWAIDGNDLGHRLDRMQQFLGEGRQVEVILASKKRGRKASLEECQGVLGRIRKAADAVDGAREAKEMNGKVGSFATVYFQGRAQKVSTTGTKGQVQAKEDG